MMYKLIDYYCTCALLSLDSSNRGLNGSFSCLCWLVFRVGFLVAFLVGFTFTLILNVIVLYIIHENQK